MHIICSFPLLVNSFRIDISVWAKRASVWAKSVKNAFYVWMESHSKSHALLSFLAEHGNASFDS